MTDTSTTYFANIPWCSRLLAQPNLRIAAPSSRTPKPFTKEDSLIALSLNNPSTIPHALIYYPRPSDPSAKVPAVHALLALSDGLNGYPAVLHGGIVATLLDEVMGSVFQVNADRKHLAAVATGHALGEIAEGIEAMTAELNVKYLQPVKTPGIALVKARVVRKEGRKIFMRAVLVQKAGLDQELDGRHIECAVGEAVFVLPRSSRL